MNQVKVIFRDSVEEDKYVQKDLDTEVLAKSPDCSRGHWIASTAIRNLRHRKVESLSEVLHILGTRSTSWPRDRLAIAHLLCGGQPDFKDPNMQATITKDIIVKFEKIVPTFLLHGCPTEEEDGVFSWCPSTLLTGAKPNMFSAFSPSE